MKKDEEKIDSTISSDKNSDPFIQEIFPQALWLG